MDHSTIESRLFEYLEGELTPEARADVERHLAACSECRSALAEARSGHRFLAAIHPREGLDLTPRILPALPPLDSPGPRWWLVPVGFALVALLTWIAWPGAGVPQAPSTSKPPVDRPHSPAVASEPVPPGSRPGVPQVVARSPLIEWTPLPGFAPDLLHEGNIGLASHERFGLANASGDLAFLAGEAHLEPSPEGLNLRTGRLWVDHRPGSPADFAVWVPGGRISLLGTVFGVEATATGSRIALFEGRIALDLPGGVRKEMSAGQVAVLAGSDLTIEVLTETIRRDWSGFLSAFPQARPMPRPVDPSSHGTDGAAVASSPAASVGAQQGGSLPVASMPVAPIPGAPMPGAPDAQGLPATPTRPFDVLGTHRFQGR